MSDLDKMRAYEKACLDLGMFCGSDASRKAIDVLSATVDSYIEELIEAKAERVIELQCSIRQLRAVIETMLGKPNASPKI